MASFSIAYTDSEGRNLKMHTLSPPNTMRYRAAQICLRPERGIGDRRCAGLVVSAESTYAVPNPGTWEVTGANGVAGVRGKPAPWETRAASHQVTPAVNAANSLLDRRKLGPKLQGVVQGRWEAWTMTAHGDLTAHEVTTRLAAMKPGPSCKVAQNAIAVALANVVILVQFGSQLRDDEDVAPAQPTHRRLSRQSSRIGRSSMTKGLGSLNSR